MHRRFNIFCRAVWPHIASTLGEVDSAFYAEDGGVNSAA